MPVPRLQLDDVAILLLDLQESLVPRIPNQKRLLTNAAALLHVATELRIPFLVGERSPRTNGRTVDPIAAAMFDPAARVERTPFSALVELTDDLLSRWRRSAVLVAGIEGHVSVLQTVLDLQATGRQAFVVSDAVAASQPEQLDAAFRRMQDAGAVITGVGSATAELLRDEAHPAARACRELVRTLA